MECVAIKPDVQPSSAHFPLHLLSNTEILRRITNKDFAHHTPSLVRSEAVPEFYCASEYQTLRVLAICNRFFVYRYKRCRRDAPSKPRKHDCRATSAEGGPGPRLSCCRRAQRRACCQPWGVSPWLPWPVGLRGSLGLLTLL